MNHRPVDESGDILPVLSSADLVRGAPVTALLIRERLNLLAGEWWEMPDLGNGILEMLRETRVTEADQQALATYLTSYIRETPGVRDVTDVTFSLDGRRVSFQCTVTTDDGGYPDIHYAL